MKYLPAPLRVIKDHLFTPPAIFRLIQAASGSDNREMYQVFNMGHRLEIFTDLSSAGQIMSAAASFGLPSKIVGRVESAEKQELILQTGSEDIRY